MLKEFKEFISRGNVLDLAVGVIIGSAFSGIVTSLVNNIFTPILGILFGGINFKGLSIHIKDATIMYGEFIQTVFDFLLTAVCLFIVVKLVNNMQNLNKKLKHEAEEEVKEEPKKSDDILLLEEIRDLLKENKKETKKKVNK